MSAMNHLIASLACALVPNVNKRNRIPNPISFHAGASWNKEECIASVMQLDMGLDGIGA